MFDVSYCLQQTQILRPSHLNTLEMSIEKGRIIKIPNTFQLQLMCNFELTKSCHIFVLHNDWSFIFHILNQRLFDQRYKTHTAIKRYKFVYDLFSF